MASLSRLADDSPAEGSSMTIPASSPPARHRPICGAERRNSRIVGAVEIATDPKFLRWPQGRITYQIPISGGDSPAFSAAMISTIQQGIANWNTALAGSVEFVPRRVPSDSNWLDIFCLPEDSGDGNHANIGFRPGQNQVWLY